jgi:hypothetical protein
MSARVEPTMSKPPASAQSDPAAELSLAANQALDQLVKQCLTNYSNTINQQLQIRSQLSQLPTQPAKGYRVFRAQGTQTLLTSRSAPDTKGLELVYPKTAPEGETLESCLQFINQHTPVSLPKSRDSRLEGNELARELRDLERTVAPKPSSQSQSKPDKP